MTNTNDVQRRPSPKPEAVPTVPLARQGRHANVDAGNPAPAKPTVPVTRRPQNASTANPAAATGAIDFSAAQTTGSMPAHSRQGVQQQMRRPVHSRPAGNGKAPSAADLSMSLPTLDPQDVQQPTGAPVITFDHVTKVYPAQPNRPSLHDISLQIYAGEFVFLVGHSGSGKSTFIRLITRELKPTDGHIYIAGEDLTSMRNWRVPYLRRNIGCVFQDFKLLPNKTVFENVAFALEVIGKSRHVIRTQVPEVLRLVGLQDKLNKRPDQLSGGEQQRVSIARAIVNRPPLLVCDEPTGNLDPQTSRGIMDLLERINRTGTTVLVATHDREMVDNMRRRVIALDNGQLTRDQDRGVYGFDV